MAANAYHLDTLIGQAGAAALYYGVTVNGYTRGAATDPLVLSSIQVTTEGKPGAGGAVAGIGEFYRVSAVNDVTNAITLLLYQGNTVIGTMQDYVVGFGSNALLLSTTGPGTLASVLNSRLSAEPLLGVLSASAIASGTVLSFTSTGVFSGALGGPANGGSITGGTTANSTVGSTAGSTKASGTTTVGSITGGTAIGGTTTSGTTAGSATGGTATGSTNGGTATGSTTTSGTTTGGTTATTSATTTGSTSGAATTGGSIAVGSITGGSIADSTTAGGSAAAPADPATSAAGSNGGTATTGTVSVTGGAPPISVYAIAPLLAVQAEGNAGATPFTFTVTRSGDTNSATAVTYAVTGSGANPASAMDFVGGALPTGSVSFAPGDVSQVLTVNVQGDTVVEPDQGFTVTLSGGAVSTGTANGVIVNDDLAPPPPPPSGAMLGYADGTNGKSGVIAMDAAAAGGPGYLQNQYIYSGNDNLALSTLAPNVFIHSGGGTDAIQVSSGQNVLDGGLGSNFLTGGSGKDTFFTDARAPGAVWNTIRNFHAGDAATLWGYVAGVSSFRFEPGVAGAAGAEGATLRANIVGGGGRIGDGVDASITFTGMSVAQAQGLQIVTGTAAAGSYLFIYNPGV